MYDPLASHLSLPTGGTKLGPRSLVWTAPAAPAETNSGANANGAPGKTCHLRLDHRARPPQTETTDRSGPRLWRLLDSATNAGGLRGDGDDQERAGSEHWWQRHQGPGKVHRRAVPGYCLSCHLILSQNDPPTADAKLCNRTLNLAYHGARAQDQSFTINLHRDFGS